MTESAALRALLDASTLDEARSAVDALVRAGYGWTPLGAKEGNFGLVNIGSDPALAFIERITNALDAILELRAAEAEPALLASLESPRDASRALFGVTEGRLAHLDERTAADVAERVVVSVRDGSSSGRPVLEVRDFGIGLTPAEMPDTILNLAGSNKIGKPYVAGAYGQGGSTTFAFSPGGTVIASATETSDVGVTFVRYRELEPRRNKNGRYEYLVRSSTPVVGMFEALGGPPDVAALPAAATRFGRGTLVRHFNYDLPDGAENACTSDHGLGARIESALFDPILPFTLVECRRRFTRTAREPVRRVIRGRLGVIDSAPAGTIAHRNAATVVLRSQRRVDPVSVHYWVLAAEGGPLHPDPTHPVVVTNFGQTHGYEDRRFVVDELRLPYLKNALVIQIELDTLSAATKRELLSTTRDRLKRGATYRALLDAVRDALLDDAALQQANAERRRRLLERQSAADQKKLRRRFIELMEKFRPGAEPAIRTSRNGAVDVAAAYGESGEGDGAEVIPLPTLEHPTFVRIARGDGPISLVAGRTARVRLESDAPDGYIARYAEARVVAVGEPPGTLEFVRASDFRAGRARVAVRASGGVGLSGMLTVRLTDAEGTVHVDSAAYVVVEPPPPAPAEPDGAKGARVPDIYEIYKADWDRYEFTEESVSLVNESRDDYSIFVNMDNMHLQRLLTSVEYLETGLARMRGSYLVQVAFYAFLLHEATPAFGAIEETELEQYQRLELDRVARTVVTSIASVERIDSSMLIDAE